MHELPDPRIPFHVMHHVLKILSGSLSGVEYTLSDTETLFHVGPQQELINGNAARLLGHADNAYYIPAEAAPAAFMLRCLGDDGVPRLQLGERAGEQAAWTWREAPLQTPHAVAGIHVAIRHRDASWSEAVTAFVPPALPAALASSEATLTPPRTRRRGAVVLLATAIVALVAVGAGWFHWHYLPETRIRGLAGVLHDAPADFQIIAGEDDRLYVFADTPADKAWAERASRRLQRRHDVHVVRQEQVRRLEQALIEAGLDVVLVRLENPARPTVVLAGAQPGRRAEQVKQVLGGKIPWQHALQVEAITDQQLIAQARQALRVRGISTRVEPDGTRASVVNDVYLDDAALSQMTAAAAEFQQQWGTRRITIIPRLWDDLLQGRSYRYTPGQLLSIGNGRWDYAGGAGSAAPASP